MATAGLLLAAALPAHAAGTAWLHDDSYVSGGEATAYVDVDCPEGERGWTLKVRLTSVRPGRPSATGSATAPVTCRGVPDQNVIDVRPDSTPFFGSHDERSSGVADVIRPDGTVAASSTRRMHFYVWS
ncbi:hypothetical protein AOZ06_17150 [Kibdelosporangium phytohabitans]|uniref:Uncharacterized protein n=1 Tax=Kibdelosporangium phytohabitans TaxID=860235 RepID=A0A0N9I1W9_9PSEU|nr:hypothetical protein AOZ06_17150 [Kibdelosporangium phytohabitans]